MMKKSILLASSLSLILLANLSTYAASTDNKKTWYINLKGLYAQPSNINFYETYAGAKGESVHTKANYNPGYGLEIGYNLKNDIDLSINYTEIKSYASHSSSSADVPNATKTKFYSFEKVKFLLNYNSLNLRLGRTFDSMRLSNHIFVGLDYTTIKDKTVFEGVREDYADGKVVTTHEHPAGWDTLALKGLGPQIGFTSNYSLVDHVDLVGGAAFSFLETRYADADDPRSYYLKGPTYNLALKAVVNVGVSYATNFYKDNTAQVELGYQTLYLQNNSIGYSYSVHGPYLGMKIYC